MAETLNFREAVQRAGVSRQRLNEAIKSGRLQATRGGGPGKPTTIQLEDLQAWCLSEGLAMPVAGNERLERLPPTVILQRLERLDELFAGMQRLEHLMTQVLERLERSEVQAIEPHEPIPSTPAHQQTTALPPDRAAVISRIRHRRDVERREWQAIADELNAEGVPTFSGRGAWGKGSVRRFYRQGQ